MNGQYQGQQLKILQAIINELRYDLSLLLNAKKIIK